MADPRPIGVFDSGIGGLTVFRALSARLRAESLLYLGDTARVPYGTKSEETVTRYTRESARFLLRRGIKALVVACNTASALALPALADELPVPSLGVIDPGARRACRASATGRIGVIATEATIRSAAYPEAIRRARREARVTAVACPLFVPLAEEGWAESEVALLVARSYLSAFDERGIDAMVLGCTHYPLLRGVIAKVLGDAITLVDSAAAVAEETAMLLAEKGLLAEGREKGSHHFFVTDSSRRFEEVGSRFLGMPLARLEQVDITGES
ncbi:MAG TPA: glutamate racemase [Candidatus Polarisedimenticolia bacterium]|nr:glutamate racemase [Candidatus Polarisedimenticolia bacterium]